MHLPANVKTSLEKWLRDHTAEISRDGMSISEGCVRATKALNCRVHRNNMEDAAIAIGFAWGKPAAAPVAPPPPPLPPPPPAPKEEEDEVVQLATEYAVLKRRILSQSEKVEEAKRFSDEAAAMWKKEQDSLADLVREQHRIRTVLKEAMEV